MIFKFILLNAVLMISLASAEKPYRGAEYRTINTYQYGRFEVRMKSAMGSGVVSSFFTIRDFWADGLSNTVNWMEIDFEAIGKYTDKFQTNIISAYENHHEELHTLLYNPHVGFHVYAFEWTPDYIDFYIDGQLIRHDENNYIGSFNVGQKIMMNIWQPIWEDWVGVFEESILPIYAFYDWVKLYSYTPGSGSYGANNNFSFEWMDEFNAFDQSRWQKATHTWSANNAQFVQENAVLQDGYLILCLTDNTTSGYSGDPLSIYNNINTKNIDYIMVYPNPFNNSFSIQLPYGYDEKLRSVHLYDLNGKTVLSTTQFKVYDGKINFSLKDINLSSGLYYGFLKTNEKRFSFKLTYIR